MSVSGSSSATSAPTPRRGCEQQASGSAFTSAARWLSSMVAPCACSILARLARRSNCGCHCLAPRANLEVSPRSTSMLAPLAAWVTSAHAIRPTHMGLASMQVRFRFWDLHRLRPGPVSSNRGWRMRPIIMVVDDELDILDIVAQLLEGEGYAVVAFSDGHAALDYAR